MPGLIPVAATQARSHTVCLTLPMQDTRALKAGKKGPVKKKPKSKGLWSTGGISK